MSQIAKRQEMPVVLQKLDVSWDRIRDVLPKTIDESGFKRQVYAAIYANSELQNCEPVSVVMAVMEAASFGLRVASHLGEGHLIPFDKKAKFIPDYKGLVRLARRNNPRIAEIYAYCVYKQDHFRVSYGLDHTFEHVPDFDHGFKDDDITGCYAVVKYSDGGFDWVYWPLFKLLQHRDIHSKAYRFNPAKSMWSYAFPASCCKTMLKQLMKFTDISEEARKAIEIDDNFEYGVTETPLVVDPLQVDPAAAGIDIEAAGKAPAAQPKPTEQQPDPQQPAAPSKRPGRRPTSEKKMASEQGQAIVGDVRRAREEAIDVPVSTPEPVAQAPEFSGPAVEITLDDVAF